MCFSNLLENSKIGVRITAVDFNGIHPTLNILHVIKLAHLLQETRDGKILFNKNIWQ